MPHAEDKAGALQSILLFISGESMATLTHLTYWSGCSWDVFCLAFPAHLYQLRRDSQILHRYVLFGDLKTQPGQCSENSNNAAYLSSRLSKASTPGTGELSDSVCTLQAITILPRAPMQCPSAPSPSHLPI